MDQHDNIISEPLAEYISKRYDEIINELATLEQYSSIICRQRSLGSCGRCQLQGNRRSQMSACKAGHITNILAERRMEVSKCSQN